MEPSRRTLDDTDTFVIPQFWEARDHSVWWDLRYLHHWLTGSGWEQLALNKWLKVKFTKLVARTGFPLRAPPEGVGQCVADTFALVAFFWDSADGCRDSAMRDACVARVRAMISKACLLYTSDAADE